MNTANAVVVDDASSVEATVDFESGDWSHLTTSDQSVKGGTLSELQGPGGFGFVFIGEQSRTYNGCASDPDIKHAGSEISVFGSIAPTKQGTTPTAVTSTYLIDGAVVGSYTAQNLTQQTDGIQFWASSTLDVQRHLLTVQVTSATSDYPFLFDYLLFMPPPTVTSDALPGLTDGSGSATSASRTSSILSNGLPLSATSVAPSLSGSTISESSRSSSSSYWDYPTQGASKSSSTTNSINIGAIVGGVVGGIAGLSLVILVCFHCWRRRRQSQELDTAEGMSQRISCTPVVDLNRVFVDPSMIEVNRQNNRVAGVTPYLLPRDYNTTSASVIQRETAGPIAPGVSGVSAIPISHKEQLGTQRTGPSTSGQSSSQQRLLAEPSEVSSASAPSSQNDSGASDHNRGVNTEGQMGADSRRPVPVPKELTTTSNDMPPGTRHRHLPALHEDSGLRFPLEEVPALADEAMSQAPSEYPPAYTFS